MRRVDPYTAVDESLQTDVMRFMAIIAICLIAILALVRGVETGPPRPVPLPPARQPVPETAEPVAAREVARPRPVVAVEAPVARPELPTMPQIEVVSREAPESPAAAPEPVPASAPAGQPSAAQSAQQPGLSLRFASDQDFLRLLSRGRIQVYAFTDDKVLRVDQGLGFVATTAPGRIHELLPETIPALMSSALARHEAATGFRWGMAMPDRMARQVQSYVERGATGELIIDRYGEVRLDAGA